MARKQKMIQCIAVLAVLLMIGLSILDATEKQYETNFSQDNIVTHVENLTVNGPRSIVDEESHQLALNYIVSELESYGFVNEDTTEVPAYQIQDFVAKSEKYQNWYLKNIIVHIPANAEKTTGEAVMFMGHTDSVPTGPGASDDGIAVSVMLEAIRYYTEQMAQGYTLSNDLVFCFVDGEEYGLYGSEAFMNEFVGFEDVVSRIKFGTNLESRGTYGTLIMFETAENNYNTVQLFSEMNENVFSCSIATMIYDMMPNGTDFSNFKEAYQGLNFANINGGENYHTQNDALENIGMSYLSQQAMIVDTIIDTLADYDLDLLYDAKESAIFFSYLNITTVVYNHTVTVILGILLLAMLIANVVLNWKKHNFKKTSIAIGVIAAGLVLAAAVTYACYYVFQWVAVLAGVIDCHMVNTITYSNNYIVIGIGLVALAVTMLTSRMAVKYFKISYRDLTRGFAYIHAFFGVVLSFVLADASYLLVFSGMMFMLNELLITYKEKIEDYRLELWATALYMPIVMPILLLATSALGLTMAYVYGLLFALAIFGLGISLSAMCDNLHCKKITTVKAASLVLASALVIFACVSVTKVNPYVNLQGKQGITKLPFDDALVYVVEENGDAEYRIYDLNAFREVKEFALEMEWNSKEECYIGEGKEVSVEYAILSEVQGNTLTVTEVNESAQVYLTFSNIDAESFTVDDGITSNVFEFGEEETFSITLHSDCIVTIHGGSADVEYKEVIRDYEPLIPEGEVDKLHFNLWLTAEYELGSER